MKKIYFEDLREGEVFWGDEVDADAEEMLAYSRQNDPWPIHVDEAAAKLSPFGSIVASRGYTITLMYRSLIGVYNTPERRWELFDGFDWKLKFANPVRPRDRLRAKLTINKKRPSNNPGRGILNCLTKVINQDGGVVMSLDADTLVATRPD